MNENLENQLAKAIEKSIEVAEQTGQFVLDQAPDLLREFYAWHIASSSMGILLGISFFIIAYISVLLIGSKREIEEFGEICSRFKGRYYDSDRKGGAFTVGVVLSIIGAIILSTNIYNLMYILVAPKLYLIEYFIK